MLSLACCCRQHKRGLPEIITWSSGSARHPIWHAQSLEFGIKVCCERKKEAKNHCATEILRILELRYALNSFKEKPITTKVRSRHQHAPKQRTGHEDAKHESR